MERFKNDGYAVSLITHRSPRSALAEAYRTLRTNLGFAAVDHPCRTLLVTSPGPEDGKTTTAANLAVALAQAGNTVLLVDADLRKPSVHKIFQVENVRGLTNCLLLDVDPLSLAVSGPAENLFLLTSGPIPPNPAELLGSAKARALWPGLLERFAYVVVDSPPVLAVTDSSLLASQVDGVLLVIRTTTRVEIAGGAKDQLLKANARIVGVILNRVKMPSRGYRYYYYYHYRGKEKEVQL